MGRTGRTGCRIGRVRLKAGGGLVYLLPRREAVDPDGVDKLQRLLERMHAGDVIGVAAAAVRSDGSVVTFWSDGAAKDAVGTLGALEILSARVNHSLIED